MKLYVEDHKAHFGPVDIALSMNSTLGDLKDFVTEKYGFPRESQKWIIGKLLLNDKKIELKTSVMKSGANSIYLYIITVNAKKTVEPVETKGGTGGPEKPKAAAEPKDEVKKAEEKEANNTGANKATKAKNNAVMFQYEKLENLNLIPNVEEFVCQICFLDIEPGDGVVLRECLHTFCKYVGNSQLPNVVCIALRFRDCLVGTIEHAEDAAVKCPYKDNSYSCDMRILDREIKAVRASFS